MNASAMPVVTARSWEIRQSARNAYYRDLERVRNTEDAGSVAPVLSRRARMVAAAVLTVLALVGGQYAQPLTHAAAAHAAPLPPIVDTASAPEQAPAPLVNQGLSPQ